MEKRMFYHCELCGNMFEVIKNSGQVPVCCGQKMTLLEANKVDASNEKHVPFLTRNGEKLNVKVGSVEHPMEAAHFIEWIIVVQGDNTQRIALHPGEKPAADFILNSATDPVVVYEHCNLHGLWMAEG